MGAELVWVQLDGDSMEEQNRNRLEVAEAAKVGELGVDVMDL